MMSSSSNFDAAYSISILEKYDVFISFRGEDTRKTFTSHLIAALRRYQIETYFDEDTLERGDEISQALREAIRRSKISIIVFSENYASSSWCLGELQHILECHQENYERFVMPIFYNVNPSDVRKQQGIYAVAFQKHEERYKNKMEMVQKWKDALTKSADLSGWDSQVTSPESKLVEAIAQDVLTKLKRNSSGDIDFDGLIGIEEHIEKIKLLLSSGSSNAPNILGIWGIGGVGKTTIAEAVFNQFSRQFESCCFLRNIREETNKHGLMNLRDKLLNELFKGENIHVGTSSLPAFLKERLSRKKVLIVLDDVNDSEQLETLVGNNNRAWFNQESTIIITTRNAQLLKGTKLEVATYKVEELNDDKSLQLFKLTAFSGKSPSTDHIKLLKEVVRYAGGIPLAIKILGSHLRTLLSESTSDWEMVLAVLKEDCSDKMVKIFQISFDGLNKYEKDIFLDIACFFKGEDRSSVEKILDGCSFKATERIKYLIDKSLITMDCSKVWMHDLVQEMGWNVVQQSTNRLGERSRLWKAEDGYHVLSNNQGTEQIEGIFLDMSQIKEDLHLRSEVFQNMSKLRLLRISNTFYDRRNRVHLRQDLQSLSNKLTYLYRERCPLKHFPLKFKPLNLVELHLPNCHPGQFLDRIQDLSKLRIVDLSSIHLTKIPDFSRAQNLAFLDLSSTRIKQLPSPIVSLNNLSELKLINCIRLTNIPSSMRKMDSLRSLNLGGCSSLLTFPELPENIESIVFSRTTIIEVPSSSIEYCKKLVEIHMNHCKRLRSVPTIMFKSTSLLILKLNYCPKLKNLWKSLTGISCGKRHSPDNFFSISSVSLTGSNISKIPPDIKQLRCLQILTVNNCKKIESIPELPLSLELLQANGCTSLVSTPNIALTPGFWDYNVILGGQLNYSMFCGCLKLDKNARHNIITDFQLRVLRTEMVMPMKYGVNTCCPGDEIPKWFSYSAEGSSIHMKLPPQWHNSNFLGFAVCAVVATGPCTVGGDLNICCEFDLIPSNSDCFAWDFEIDWPEQTFDSDNVFMWYWPSEYSACRDAVEAEFNFYSFKPYYGKYFERINQSSEGIKRCGIHILYRQDVDELFSLINNQHLSELYQPAAIPDQTGPSAPSTIESDTEEPHPKRIKHF